MNTTALVPTRLQRAEASIVHAGKVALHAVDVYTTPRKTTAGNFEKPSAVVAFLSGTSDGLLYFGPAGIMTGAGSAMAAYAANRLTNNRTLGALASTAAGVGLCALSLAIAGHPITLPVLAASGAIFGLFEAGRTDRDAERRDASTCVMMLPMLLPGPTRFTVAIGSALGQDVHNPIAKAAIGAVSAAALTAAVTAIGGAVAVPLVIASAIGGAVAPVLGHRIWQGARNLMADGARGAQKLLVKTGVIHKHEGEKKPPTEMQERRRNMVGAMLFTIPTSMLKADGNVVYALIATALKATQQAYVMLKGQAHPGDITAEQMKPPSED